MNFFVFSSEIINLFAKFGVVTLSLAYLSSFPLQESHKKSILEMQTNHQREITNLERKHEVSECIIHIYYQFFSSSLACFALLTFEGQRGLEMTSTHFK